MMKTNTMRPVRELHAHDSNLVLVAVIFISIAFPLHIAGYASPGWYIVHHDVFVRPSRDHVRIVRHEGLWYDVNCEDGTCTVFGKADLRHNPLEIVKEIQQWWLGYQIKATIAMAASLCAIVAAIAQRKSSCSKGIFWVLLLMFVFVLVAGILGLVASGKMADTIHERHNESTKSTFIFPYSCFIFGLASFLMCLAAIFLFVVLVRMPLNIQSTEAAPIEPNEVVWIAKQVDGHHDNDSVNRVTKKEVEDLTPSKIDTKTDVSTKHPIGVVSGIGGLPESNYVLDGSHVSPAAHREITKLPSTSILSGYIQPQSIRRPSSQAVGIVSAKDEARHQPLYENIIQAPPQKHYHRQRLTYVPSASVYIHQPNRQYYAVHNSSTASHEPLNSGRASKKDDGILGAL